MTVAKQQQRNIQFLSVKHHKHLIGELRVRELCRKIKLLEPIDADKIRISRDHYFKGAYVIDLPLDSVPNHVWQDIFDREWRASRRMWDRKLFIVGNKLRLITTANELEEKITWIKQLIQQTNKEIDEYNQTTPVEKQLKKTTALAEEKVEIEAVRDVLKSKLGASFSR